MKKITPLITLFLLSILAQGQVRYLDEVFTDADIEITSDVVYGTNVNYLVGSDFTDPQTVVDVQALWGLVLTGQPIPAAYYNPADTTTEVKVQDVAFDIYKPKASSDTVTKRPVFIYLHTGSFLPICVNGGVTGEKIDSSGVNLCKRMAKRGYVAISATYRGGWNPLAASALERKAQLLNAVYRALMDLKQLVRTLKADATVYNIDPNKIAMYGQGTGGYIGLGYGSLDKHAEMTIPKFQLPNGNSVIDTSLVGNINGEGPVGSLNLYVGNGQNADVQTIINTGGAMPDTSWINAGEAPIISFHCLRDPYAPFMHGDVLTPPNKDFVVEVQGAGEFMKKVNALGNNNAFYNKAWMDPYTMAARSKYGKTYNYIQPAPDDKITLHGQVDIDGVYPVILPLGSSYWLNQNSPWEFWDQPTAIAKCGATTNGQALAANPGMSSMQSATYNDTILGYMTPRLCMSLDLGPCNNIGIDEAAEFGNFISMYPNPAQTKINFDISEGIDVDAIEIYDISGRMVLSSEVQDIRTVIDVSTLKSGVYIVKAKTSEGVLSQRLIKQ